MEFDLVISGGEIVSGKGTFRGSVGISSGRVAALAAEGTELRGKVMVNAEGLMVLPGLIDAHSHAGHGDPDRENFAAFSRACAAGGITTFIDMSLSNPSTLTVQTVREKIETSGAISHVDYALYGGVVPGYLDHIESMVKEGVGAFKSFTCRCSNYPMTDDGTLLQGMKILEKTGGILSVHAENDTLIQNLVDRLMAEGKNGPRAYLDSHPPYSELEAVQRVFFLAAQAPLCRVHIAHVSIPEGMELLRRLRGEGMNNISAETCPQYLGMNAEDLEAVGAFAKSDPPVRTPEAVERMWELVIDGTVDIIASDHSPHPLSKKTEVEADFWKVAEGCTGVQTMFPVVLTEGRKRGLSWERLVQLMAERPAELFGLSGRKGSLMPGMDGDVLLVDPEKEWVLEEKDLQHLVKHSPFTDRTFRGRVVRTYVRGELVYDDNAPEKIVNREGWGKYCPAEVNP